MSRIPLVFLLLAALGVFISPNIWNRPYDIKKGSIHLPLSSFPEDLNIATAYNSVSYALLNQIVKPPLAYEIRDGQIALYPYAVSSWLMRTQGDRKVHTLILDNEHYFNEHIALENQRKKVTTDDFLFQIARMASKEYACPIKPQLRSGIVFFEELEKRLETTPLWEISFENLEGLHFDDNQIQIETTADFNLEAWFTLPFFAPYPRQAEVFYQTHEKGKKLAYYPISNGNFSIKKFLNDEVIHLSSHIKPHENSVTDVFFHADSESLSILQKFQSGYFDSLSPNVKIIDQIFKDKSLSSYRKDWESKNLQKFSFSDPVAFYIGFNMKSPNIKSQKEFNKVRQLIASSLDWEMFCEDILDGLASPSKTFLPSSLISKPLLQKGFDKSSRLEKNFSYEPVALKMLYPKSNSPFAQRFKSWIIESLDQVGIDLIIFEMDFADMHHQLEENEHDMFWAGWGADFPDPLNFYMLLYSKNSLLDSGGENLTNFSNKSFDYHYENFQPSSVAVLEEIIAQQAPLIPAFNPKSILLDHSWLKRLEPQAFINHSWSSFEVDHSLRAKYIEEQNQVHKKWLYFLISLIALLILRRESLK